MVCCVVGVVWYVWCVGCSVVWYVWCGVGCGM